MELAYNIPGKVDKENTKLKTRILTLKGEGLTFHDIAFLVKRSEKRVKEIYYKNKPGDNSK